MAKDWTGNKNSIYKTLGASNHTDKEREKNDYYSTHPIAGEWLLKLETLNKNIWEISAGEKHLSNVFESQKYNVRSSDIIVRIKGVEQLDFLSKENEGWKGVDSFDIITNPPYKFALEFLERALELVPDGCKVIMFLKIQFLESKGRRKFFDKFPPKTVWVSSSRISCAKNGDFEKYKESASCYCWYIWEKGYIGDTIIKWFN